MKKAKLSSLIMHYEERKRSLKNPTDSYYAFYFLVVPGNENVSYVLGVDLAVSV